jgi:hypothetical protein
MHERYSWIGALCVGASVLLPAAVATAAPQPPPRAQAAATGTARGVVKAVTGQRLVVETTEAGGAGSVTVILDGQTVVQRLGKTLTAKDLKAGDPVTVSYVTRAGQAVAQRVWVRTGAAAAAPRAAGGGSPAGR